MPADRWPAPRPGHRSRPPTRHGVGGGFKCAAAGRFLLSVATGNVVGVGQAKRVGPRFPGKGNVMGFFSANCEGCGHPLLSVAATEEINRWMNLGVAITRAGSVLKGS